MPHPFQSREGPSSATKGLSKHTTSYKFARIFVCGRVRLVQPCSHTNTPPWEGCPPPPEQDERAAAAQARPTTTPTLMQFTKQVILCRDCAAWQAHTAGGTALPLRGWHSDLSHTKQQTTLAANSKHLFVCERQSAMDARCRLPIFSIPMPLANFIHGRGCFIAELRRKQLLPAHPLFELKRPSTAHS